MPLPPPPPWQIRQRCQKALLGSRAHDGQPKWLVPLACDLCDRLVTAHANGAGHPQRRHAITDAPCNQQRVLGCKVTWRDVDKGLVDGYALNARGLVARIAMT